MEKVLFQFKCLNNKSNESEREHLTQKIMTKSRKLKARTDLINDVVPPHI